MKKLFTAKFAKIIRRASEEKNCPGFPVVSTNDENCLFSGCGEGQAVDQVFDFIVGAADYCD